MSSTQKLTVSVDRSTHKKITDVALSTGRPVTAVVREALSHYFTKDQTEQMWQAQYSQIRQLHIHIDQLKRRINVVSALVMTSSNFLFCLSPLVSDEEFDQQCKEGAEAYKEMIKRVGENADLDDRIYPRAVLNYIIASTSDPDAEKDARKLLAEAEEEFREADRTIAEYFDGQSTEDQEEEQWDEE